METTEKRREGKKRDWVKKEDIPQGCALLKGTPNVDYLVSPYGEVFGHNLKTDKYYRVSLWMNTCVDYRASGIIVIEKSNYFSVTLSYLGASNKFFIHRLVAMFFCRNDDPVHKTEVDHLDGNRKNNDYRNLEWVTKEENNLRKRIKRGWEPYSEARLRWNRAQKTRARDAHRLRKQHLQESNLFNN